MPKCYPLVLYYLECVYKRFQYVAVNEGDELETVQNSNIKTCRETCNGNIGCNNIRYCPHSKTCKLFRNTLTGHEIQTVIDDNCFTSYKQCKCNIYIHYSN